jgi:hypothetical protein
MCSLGILIKLINELLTINMFDNFAIQIRICYITIHKNFNLQINLHQVPSFEVLFGGKYGIISAPKAQSLNELPLPKNTILINSCIYQ